MTRSDYCRILRLMEHCRELMEDAETDAVLKNLQREYREMADAIRPYSKDPSKLTDD